MSPIDYLIKVRIEKAAALLTETDATLKEISMGVGYQDPSYLGRLFKKYKGVSPLRYREEKAAQEKQADCPSRTIESSVVPSVVFHYTNNVDNDYQHRSYGEEDLFMFNNTKPKLASLILLSCMLLLGACGMSSSGTSPTVDSASPQPSPSSLPTATEQAQTKIVSTVNGDVEVPLHPKRIVAGEYLGSLIALGITPIGTSDHHIKNPYFQEYLSDVENIGDGNENVEKICRLSRI